MKEYISVAEWTSNNEFNLLYTNDEILPMVLTRLAMDLEDQPNKCYDVGKDLERLFNNKYLVEAKLRGWVISIETIPCDNDPECDVADVYITILHPNPEVTALESELIHKMLSHTPIKFKEATDNRSMAETFRRLT